MATGEILECGRIHPAALIPPPMSAEDYAALKGDIAANGLLHPIRTIDGLIIDGRHRFQVCMELGLEPSFEEYDGPLSPLAYVIANTKHRHMSPAQKAEMALGIEEYEAAEAKKRQQMGKERIPDPIEIGQARDKAATVVGVNPRYVSDAKRLKQEAPSFWKSCVTTK